MAKCEYCGQEMPGAKGCTFGRFELEGGKIVRRQKVGDEGWYKKGQRCGDCDALFGNYHHFGCDMETCPACGGQAAFCGCVVMLVR